MYENISWSSDDHVNSLGGRSFFLLRQMLLSYLFIHSLYVCQLDQ